MTRIPPWRRWLLPIAKLLVLAIVLLFVGRTVEDGWHELGQGDWELSWGWLLVSGLCYLVGVLFSGWFWWQSLRAVGGTPAWGITCWAYFVGHLAKYVPGKALVVILRAGLLPRASIALTPAVICVFLETLTLMAVGAFWAALLLPLVIESRWEVVTGAVVMLLVAGIPTCPPVVRALLRFVIRLSLTRGPQVTAGAAPTSSVQLDGINLKLFAQGWLAGTASWLFFAWHLWATLRAIGVTSLGPIGDLPLLVAAMTMSIVGGFVSMLPGGLGVRDAVLVALLAPFLGDGPALLAAVLARLVSVVSELLACGILYGTTGRTAPPPPPS